MAQDFGNGEAEEQGMAAVNRLIQENGDIFSDKHCKVCSAVLISESQKLAHYQSKKHANKYRRYMSIQEFTPAKKMKTDDTLKEASDEGDRNKCCPVCNMTFSSPVVAMSHYEGKTHSKNLKLREQGVAPQAQGAPRVAKPAPAPAPASSTPPPGTTAVPAGYFDKSNPEKFCMLCNATFNNPQMAEQHYQGKKHKKQETKSKLMTIYTTSGSTLPKSTPAKLETPGSGATGNWFNCDTCNVVLNSIEQYQAHISGFKHKNNLKGTVPTNSDRLLPTPDRKSFGPLPSAAPSTDAGFSSSAGGLSSSGVPSSMAGYIPSQDLSKPAPPGTTASGEGLLPHPSYPPPTQQTYYNDTIGPDSYNYFDQTY